MMKLFANLLTKIKNDLKPTETIHTADVLLKLHKTILFLDSVS